MNNEHITINNFLKERKMKKLIIVSVMFIACFSYSAVGEWTTPVPVLSGINTQYTEVVPY